MRRQELVYGGLEAVPYAFENERMLQEIYDLYPDIGKSTIPFAIMDPLREPEAQLTKLRELHARYPFYVLKIQATIIQSDITALLNVGRGFLDFAAEFNLPFIIHSSIAPPGHVVSSHQYSPSGRGNSRGELLPRAFLPL